MWWRVLVVSAAVAQFSGCGGDDAAAPLTELVVVVDSDLAVPTELDAVGLVVLAPRGRFERLIPLTGADAVPLPLSLGVQHTDGALEPVRIEAHGRLAGATVVDARAVTGWVRGESRLVRLVLTRSCTGVTCADSETCRDGGCVSACVPASELPPFTGTIPRLDASVPQVDAGPGDAGADAGPACACRDARDECTATTCARPDYTCNSLEPCDTGYTCNDGLCECTDAPVCGIDCSVSLCPPSQTCDASMNVCREPLWCLFDESCAEGERCIVARCLRVGSTPVGGACASSQECASGRCDGTVCLQACKRNADCPGTQSCTDVSELGFVCVALASCGGGFECDASQACSSNECHVVCASNDDCADTDACTFGATGMDGSPFPSCQPTARACDGSEIELGDTGGAFGTCMIDRGCWDDADCRGMPGIDYSCTTFFGEIRFCAR